MKVIQSCDSRKCRNKYRNLLTKNCDVITTLHEYDKINEYEEVYVGHTSIWRFSHHPWWNGNVCFMDTGAGWGGKLSIMDINTKKFWQSDVVAQLYPDELGR